MTAQDGRPPMADWVVPVLTGELVTLRPIGPSDADALWTGATDPEARRLAGVTADVTREEIDSWAADAAGRPGRFDWAMTVGSDQMCGEIVLEHVDPVARAATMRQMTLPGHRGRGYGREAIMLVLRFAFGDPAGGGLGLHRVGLDVLSTNSRAAALYQSLGFVVEGRSRETYRDGERYADAIRMGMLEDEFAAVHAGWR